MRLAIIAFLLGILRCQQLAILPTSQWIWLLFAIVVGLGIISIYAKTMRYLSRLFIFFILGFVWMYWNAHSILAQQLPKEIEGQRVMIQGYVTNIPTQSKFNIQFDLQAIHLIHQQQHYPFQGKVRLKWFFHSDDEIPIVEPGQLWQFTVKLKPPHSTINFATFDYSKYLFLHRINATGNISKAANSTTKLLALSNPFNLQFIRYQLVKNLQNNISELDYAGVILAIGIGDRSLISSKQWTLFRQTGTSHLVAISGLHISSIALVAFFLAKQFWGFLGRAALWLPAVYFATIISLITAFVYVVLAGFSISAQRAFIMVIGFLLPHFFGWQLSHSYRISLALAFVLLYDPLSTLAPGFWLSFIIVSIIIYFAQFIHFHREQQNYLKNTGGWIVHLFIFQFIISIINYPLSYYFFQESGFITTLKTNLIAIPLSSFIILPITFISILISTISSDLSFMLFDFCSNALDRLFDAAKLFIQIEQFLVFYTESFLPNNITLSTVLLTIISVFILFAPQGLAIRWLGLIGFLPLFFSFSVPKPLQYGTFELTVLDVGHNLATVIKTQNHQLMYDTANSKMAFNTIKPYLKAHQIDSLDLLIASHGDNDHSGGVNNITNYVQIKQILTGTTEIERIKNLFSIPLQQHIPISHCKTGQKWQWDGVQFEILHPNQNEFYSKRNDRSCILKINGIQGSALLTGDISNRVEGKLLHSQKLKLQADILIAPHHGSKSSSHHAFIAAVKPKITIFSTAYLNHYNHPHPDVVKRYQQQHIQTLNTPETGAIRLSPDNFLQPILARETMQRIWH